jgi:DNA-directed RNA polymerase specialized sigma24 family protein
MTPLDLNPSQAAALELYQTQLGRALDAEGIAFTEAALAVDKAGACLEDGELGVLKAVAVAGQPLDAIGEALFIRPEAIRSVLHSALDKLAAHYGAVAEPVARRTLLTVN